MAVDHDSFHGCNDCEQYQQDLFASETAVRDLEEERDDLLYTIDRYRKQLAAIRQVCWEESGYGDR